MNDEQSRPTDPEALELTPEASPAPGPRPDEAASPPAEGTSAPDPGLADAAGAPAPEPLAPERHDLADHFESTRVPWVLWRVLKDPEDGVGDAHVPGTAALMYGLVVGGLCAVGIATLRLVTWPTDLEVHHGMALYLGGLTFLVSGTLASLLLRATVGKVERADWHDDVFLVGTALVHPLVGILLACLLGGLLGGLRPAFSIAGLLLGALSFRSGLLEVAEVHPGRATWIAVLVFCVACAVSAPLGFVPLLSYVPFP